MLTKFRTHGSSAVFNLLKLKKMAEDRQTTEEHSKNRVQNCYQLVANVTETLVLATRFSRLVAGR